MRELCVLAWGRSPPGLSGPLLQRPLGPSSCLSLLWVPPRSCDDWASRLLHAGHHRFTGLSWVLSKHHRTIKTESAGGRGHAHAQKGTHLPAPWHCRNPSPHSGTQGTKEMKWDVWIFSPHCCPHTPGHLLGMEIFTCKGVLFPKFECPILQSRDSSERDRSHTVSPPLEPARSPLPARRPRLGTAKGREMGGLRPSPMASLPCPGCE